MCYFRPATSAVLSRSVLTGWAKALSEENNKRKYHFYAAYSTVLLISTLLLRKFERPNSKADGIGKNIDNYGVTILLCNYNCNFAVIAIRMLRTSATNVKWWLHLPQGVFYPKPRHYSPFLPSSLTILPALFPSPVPLSRSPMKPVTEPEGALYEYIGLPAHFYNIA